MITLTIDGELIKTQEGRTILEAALEEGMITMVHDGINKVNAGLTTIEEVLRAVKEE